MQKQAIKKLNAKTRIGYQVESSILDLATVVCVHYARTKKRHLGNGYGVEGTQARGREIVKGSPGMVREGNDHQVAVGKFSEGFSFSGLGIQSTYKTQTDLGVALMKKF